MGTLHEEQRQGGTHAEHLTPLLFSATSEGVLCCSGSIELETARSGRLLEGFQRLFPQMDSSKIKSPELSEVVLSICSMVQYAFKAYEDPKLPGFAEETLQGQQIHHLN